MNTLIRSRPYYKGVTRELMSPAIETGKLRYEPGTTVEADGLDGNADQDCGKGINFCHTLTQALKWGPVVVELTVPDGETIIDAGDKLRAQRVHVEGVVYLPGANLTGANLAGVNLCDANLRGANLGHAYLARSNLAGANLRSSNLCDANLTGAYLARSNLAGADLAGANLWDAMVDSDTIISLPPGWEVVDGMIRRNYGPIG